MTILAQAFYGAVPTPTTHSHVARIGTGAYRLRIFGGPVGTSSPILMYDGTFTFTMGTALTVSCLEVNTMGTCSIVVPAGSPAVGPILISVSLSL